MNYVNKLLSNSSKHHTENLEQSANQCSASFLSDVFTTMAIINTPERKLAKLTSVQCTNEQSDSLTSSGHIEQ